MIDIKIFKVEQGFCAGIEISNRHTILIDCGYGKQFHPSQYIWKRHCNYLDYLVLPAYTQDHLAGFPDLVNQCSQHDIPIHFLVFNPTVHPEQLSDLTHLPLPLTNSLQTATNSQNIEIDGLKLSFFWNQYPNCRSNHDLSLVTFIQYRDINMILPSDVDHDGWESLLGESNFRQKLDKVNVFVASDHGQEEGYCHDVFRYCHPEVILVSNKENQSLSARMMEQYQSLAKGAPFGISDKKVLTTYEEGTISVSKCLDGLRQITTERQNKQRLVHFY